MSPQPAAPGTPILSVAGPRREVRPARQDPHGNPRRFPRSLRSRNAGHRRRIGAGKSVFTKTFIGMLDKNGRVDSGRIEFEGADLARCTTEKEWLRIRGKRSPWSSRTR